MMDTDNIDTLKAKITEQETQISNLQTQLSNLQVQHQTALRAFMELEQSCEVLGNHAQRIYNALNVGPQQVQ